MKMAKFVSPTGKTNILINPNLVLFVLEELDPNQPESICRICLQCAEEEGLTYVRVRSTISLIEAELERAMNHNKLNSAMKE